MSFDSISAFIEMGGHGVYVWAAYGITLLTIVANLVWPRIERRRFVDMEKPLAQETAWSAQGKEK